MKEHEFTNNRVEISELFCNKHNLQMIKSLGTGNPICAKCVVEKSIQQHALDVNQAVRENHVHGAQIPKRHEQSGFKNYIANTDGKLSAKNKARGYVSHIASGGKQNLVMVGSTGTGKTHLACATARNLLDKRYFARYVTSEHMANDIASAYLRTDDNEKNSIWRYTDLDLLILDEYGLHDRAEKRPQLLDAVHKVLYARYDAMKPTMLISNMSLPDLKKDLGDRLWSRFQDGGLTVIECNWDDVRVEA